VRLRVELDGEPAFEASLNVTFSAPQRRAAVVAGGRVPVRYEPGDHTKVVLDARAMGHQ